MVTEQAAVSELLDCGRVDWVSLQDVVWYSTHGDVNPESQSLAMSVLRRLFCEGLMVPGDLGETGFEDWLGTVEDWLDRAWAQLEFFGWAPMGDGFWLRMTDRGRELSEASS
ncbi:hypothetical protein [Austwickia chelonae]|uniref:hypothetical protein n=1 Tax=Austwickia chelonae TaxID=100225 RepID=UPI000E251FF1|nr:hypothetical protein [Austwickia chelonae]